MANPTTNYGFVLPTSTDLVTDLPADFDVALQGVDTRLKALQPGTTLGDIAYSSATANTNTRLPIGSNGQVLSIASGVPAWATTADQTPLTTKGDLFTFTTVDARLGIGTNNQVLTADSAQATGMKWATATSSKLIAVANFQDGAVATGGTMIPQDNTIPQNTEGDQYMTLSYTPTSATSKLQIDVVAFGGSNANCSMIIALFQDTTANALAAITQYMVGGPTNQYSQILSHTMTSGTTSAIAFKVRIGLDNAGTFTFNGRTNARLFGGVAASSITITEYTP